MEPHPLLSERWDVPLIDGTERPIGRTPQWTCPHSPPLVSKRIPVDFWTALTQASRCHRTLWGGGIWGSGKTHPLVGYARTSTGGTITIGATDHAARGRQRPSLLDCDLAARRPLAHARRTALTGASATG